MSDNDTYYSKGPALLPAQRAALRNLTRHHRGDTMITFAVPIHTDLDPAPMPNWYVQRQLDTALQQAITEEETTMSYTTRNVYAEDGSLLAVEYRPAVNLDGDNWTPEQLATAGEP